MLCCIPLFTSNPCRTTEGPATGCCIAAGPIGAFAGTEGRNEETTAGFRAVEDPGVKAGACACSCEAGWEGAETAAGAAGMNVLFSNVSNRRSTNGRDSTMSYIPCPSSNHSLSSRKSTSSRVMNFSSAEDPKRKRRADLFPVLGRHLRVVLEQRDDIVAHDSWIRITTEVSEGIQLSAPTGATERR